MLALFAGIQKKESAEKKSSQSLGSGFFRMNVLGNQAMSV